MSSTEVPLSGGNATAGVVRVDDTVRKPWTRSTPDVLAFMDRVRAAGVDVPRGSGPDEAGRQVLEFIPGESAEDLPPLSLQQLTSVGQMVRSIHDASPAFEEDRDGAWEVLLPVAGADLVCHNDLAPWNLIVGDRWVFIDWDGAGPSTRLWDLAYSAQAFTLSDVTQSPDDAAERLRAFVDGYGADPTLREALPAAMAERAGAMHALLRDSHESGRQPWGSMYVQGHGEHWLRATHYAKTHQAIWSQALR